MNLHSSLRQKRAGAFVLMEVILAVAIFTIGVLVLGECVQNCLAAEVDKQNEVRIRRILENRMSEIQAGAVPLADEATEELKGMFQGMTLTTTREALELENENDERLDNLYLVKTQVTWKTQSGSSESRALEFYVSQRR